MPRNVLFVCSKNRLRSPTAEQVFADWPGIETSSAGINRDSDNPVTPELIGWADTIICMERTHHSKLSARFRDHLRGTKVVSLGIRDNYGFMAPDLIALLMVKVPRYLPSRPPGD